MRDHTPASIVDFLGLYDRGLGDAVPNDHLSIADNVMYKEREVLTRDGTSLVLSSVTNIVRMALYKRIGEATRIIMLDNTGKFYDSTNPYGAILDLPGATDFKLQNFFGRAYITPIDAANGIGLSGEFVYVYNGTGSAIKAAGTAPSGTIQVGASALSGNVEAGFHLYAVAYETQYGYISKPGPAIYGLHEADGTTRIKIEDVPLGPAGTVKRHILATRSIIEYDGNQNGYEFFFVPNGSIDNNVDTEIEVNFFDSDLSATAEYLFDQYEEIPAGVGISEYKGRMIVWNENYVYVSKAGEPESFDALVGLILVGPGEAGYITDCVEYREQLFINKNNRSFVTSDNGGDPSTWLVSSLDKGTGCSLHGIIKILDAQGVSVDKFLLVSNRGITLFNGMFSEPELTWKINDIWSRVNKQYLYKAHGYNDTVSKRLYIAVPLDDATACSHIIYADYSKSLSYNGIRWALWSSALWQPTSILVDLNQDVPYLRIASTAGVYNQSSATKTDGAQAIISKIKTGYLYLSAGMVHHCVGCRLRISGLGTLISTLYSEDDVESSLLASITLGSSPGKDTSLLANFQNEKVALELSCESYGDWFSLNRSDLFLALLWASRPIL